MPTGNGYLSAVKSTENTAAGISVLVDMRVFDLSRGKLEIFLVFFEISLIGSKLLFTILLRHKFKGIVSAQLNFFLFLDRC